MAPSRPQTSDFTGMLVRKKNRGIIRTVRRVKDGQGHQEQRRFQGRSGASDVSMILRCIVLQSLEKSQLTQS